MINSKAKIHNWFPHNFFTAVTIFSYSNTLKSMLVVYAVTEMSCFDDYSDAVPRTKTKNGNGINTFLLHFAQCITFHNCFGDSNTDCRGIVEFILFKVIFQGY